MIQVIFVENSYVNGLSDEIKSYQLTCKNRHMLIVVVARGRASR